jgi:hypothetical protein
MTEQTGQPACGLDARARQLLADPARQRAWDDHIDVIVAAGGQEPWATAAALLLLESGCRVTKWEDKARGRAYTLRDTWDIDVPVPTDAIRFGVFAHEVAHQVLGHGKPRRKGLPRWEEELEAELWALEQFDRLALPGTDEYRKNVAAHLASALRRMGRNVSPVSAARILAMLPDWFWEVRYGPEWRAWLTRRLHARR